VVGIIGRNGAGKSTLLKILARITAPTEGRVVLLGRVGSLLEVGTGFHSELTGEENIYLSGTILGMSSREISNKFEEIVAFAEMKKFMNTPVKYYSSGMYMRLAFAVAAHLEAEILLIDEVLAVGDAQFQKKCLGKMGDVAKTGRTVLFVSHNMSAIQYLCNTAILIEAGQIKHRGFVSETVKRYGHDILTKMQGSLPAHVVYDCGRNEKAKQPGFAITRIEITDQDGHPKEEVSTWDTVIFRIHCWAPYRVQTGSVVLQISTPYGVPLLLCSTQPDSAVPMSFREGKTIVECEFVALPLAAGEYVVGGGLAIPNKEWLCKEDHLGLFSVFPKDVYQSGRAPTAPRSLLATPHTWRVI
jgi:lipopolysaccharide transport system ATP-binding protein